MPSQTPGWQAVLQRLERVERENRRLKLIGALVIAMFFGLAFAAACVQSVRQATITAKVVEAEKIILKDASGRVRAVLGETSPQVLAKLFPNPSEFLAKLRQLGESAESVEKLATEIGPRYGLALYGEDGAEVVRLTGSKGGGDLALYGSQLKSVASMAAWEGGAKLSLDRYEESLTKMAPILGEVLQKMVRGDMDPATATPLADKLNVRSAGSAYLSAGDRSAMLMLQDPRNTNMVTTVP